MNQPLLLVIGLLACFASANALPGLFSRKYITTYRYYADVKAGTIEPNPFASQFAITGLMHVKPEVSDPNLKNAFYITLNVTHTIRNGEIQHFEKISGNTDYLPDAAEDLMDPFIVTFEDSGKVESLIINKHEAGWSRNMKRSIASMLQLDLSSMHLETPMEPHSFLTNENTIYGECVVAYDVHRTPNLGEKHFTVTKMMDPMSCDHFNQDTFNSKESEACLTEYQEEMTTASRRVFRIEQREEDLLIKTLVAHGTLNYFPWNAKSEAHYILANQSIEFQSLLQVNRMSLPQLNMSETVTLLDVVFQKSESLYAVDAGVDPTHGRHVMDLKDSINKLMVLLKEASDYMYENNLKPTSPELLHGQKLTRIMRTMTRMDRPSLEEIFKNIENDISPNANTMMNLFMNMVPYVGTKAMCLFALKIIGDRKVKDSMAISMLMKLPYHVRVPTQSLLVRMEGLMNLRDGITLEVRQAGILCFATMIYKTHKYESLHRNMDPALINTYVQYYFDNMLNETTFEMQMVYMQAMSNIEVENVHTLLEPIIRGEQKVSEKPDYLRLHAMMVNWGKTRDVRYIHDLYWPILANTELPLELRICAYSILVKQPPLMKRLMNLYWFMVYEKNEHLYNFHYTTMKSLANAVSPCMTPMKEMARKVLRFTRVRPVSGIMTGAWLVGYENQEFGYGDFMSLMSVADEHTGTPYAGLIEYTSMSRRKPVNRVSLWLRVESIDGIIESLIWKTSMMKTIINIEEIENVLRRASENMPRRKGVHIEYAFMIQGRTVFAKYSNELPDVSELMAMIVRIIDINLSQQYVHFDELYTKQVPNDLGLITIFHNNIPRVMSIETNNEMIGQPSSLFGMNSPNIGKDGRHINEVINQTSLPIGMKLRTIVKEWRHGYYSMEVYNPIIDTWHAIRRVSDYDGSLSIAMSMTYDITTKNVKLTLPILPLTRYSHSGMRSHSGNYVIVIEEVEGTLARYCQTCNATELVTRGLESRKNSTYIDFHSEDTGLHFIMHQYDCERMFKPRSSEERFAQVNKYTWDNTVVQRLIEVREHARHGMIGPELGNCGYIKRLEPSTVYPTSEVEINMNMDTELPRSKTLNFFPAKKINFNGMLVTKPLDTNIPVLIWTMKINLNTNNGHTKNRMQVQMTRRKPGQKDLKICIAGYKLYPTIDLELLSRVSITNQSITGKLDFSMGEPENGMCPRNGTSIFVNMISTMSHEQMMAVAHEETHGMCQNDIDRPHYLYNKSSIVPRTVGCFREAMLRTSMRKYDYTITYKNIPFGIMSMIYSLMNDIRGSDMHDLVYLPTHTKPGIMMITAEFPLSDDGINLNVRTPSHEEKYTGLDGLNPKDWRSMLDNIYFSKKFVNDFEENRIKFCTIYPKVLLNADGAVLPFTVPRNWILLTGSYQGIGHVPYVFSVFVKRLAHKELSLLMVVNNHTMEVTPSNTDLTVTVDDKVILYQNGVTVPEVENYTFRITWSQKRLVIQSTYTGFVLEWTGSSVTLVMDTVLQGKVVGLCGQLDGAHADHMTKVYSF